ncbi:MAG: tRNA (adenosine(37)-N6)-threonylcarbamoyltransferase complex dimerization subunit type 1 TsaB [Oscillibacter sp.]|nr:tRNA (adenosine(37)-N6)-threonylcarbamoyltransferase complex dimerization subunit type 1 TsaB [Oscillibacter sp.]
MKILAIETSAKSVSAAVVENGVPLASAYQNMGLTHSRTLMPLVDGMLSAAGLRVRDMDLLATANGPGSFTGLRIGVSALKGLAWALEKPCCGVSTLAAMARNLAHMEGLIICAMDARRNQVYNALFLAHDGVLTRQCPDRAIGLAELAEEIKNRPEPKFVVGDGAGLCYNHLLEQDVPCRMAPPQLMMQNAVGVALAAEEMAAAGQVTTARDLVPVYLRLSQAERERLARGLKITLD